LKKCDMILSRIRSAYKSIAFVERTYRKKDPKYADFSVRQQQEILGRLYAEWDRSQCEDTVDEYGPWKDDPSKVSDRDST